MAYEIYPRNLARANCPTVSVSRLGRITLNTAAVQFLLEKRVANVFLLWDSEARKFALSPTEQSDSSTYQVRFARANAGAGFSAKPFLRLIGYDFEETRALPTAWNDEKQMFEVTLPQEGFNRQRFPRARSRRRGGSDRSEPVLAGAEEA